ncbi:MAG TPA: helix-turn-helix domain-containing protein [Solirubrobacteraceae bacterium]|jgi:PucR C-terminal helix-turn-helix domain|nr:helix-turn-helix domain-containing protein [Solirubrobacteraceae bacterium]
MTTPHASFAAVPPEAADVLRPALPGLADEMIAAISLEVPDYARAMEGTFGQLVRMGVEVALNRFMDMVADPRSDARRARDTYVNLGRGEFHAGRSLDALLAAYRVGARLAWRRFVEAGTAAGLSPEVLYSLGEAIFAYIDEISAESADGYAEEQSAAAGESQRRRRRLVRLLAQHPPATQESVRTAAQAAAWPLPRRVAALVCAEAETAAGADAQGEPPGRGEAVPGEEMVEAAGVRLARRLGGAAIGGAAGGLACVWLPDPDAPGRRKQLIAQLDPDDPVALGPTVDWARAAESLRRAAAAFRLAAAGRAPGGLVVAEDHLATLLLAADRDLAAALAASRLAPLATLADGPRARLTETLRAWLDRPGQVQAVAAELGVHPQTVRYRIRQLRELFGTRLEDPEARFELALALRVG